MILRINDQSPPCRRACALELRQGLGEGRHPAPGQITVRAGNHGPAQLRLRFPLAAGFTQDHGKIDPHPVEIRIGMQGIPRHPLRLLGPAKILVTACKRPQSFRLARMQDRPERRCSVTADQGFGRGGGRQQSRRRWRARIQKHRPPRRFQGKRDHPGPQSGRCRLNPAPHRRRMAPGNKHEPVRRPRQIPALKRRLCLGHQAAGFGQIVWIGGKSGHQGKLFGDSARE